MQMLKLTKFHKKLEALAGRWSGEETMYPTPWDPAGGKAQGSTRSRLQCDGFCLVQEYVQKRNGKISYRGLGVMGYDPAANCYLWHWTDTIGGMPCQAMRGEWTGNKLVFSHGTEEGHVRYSYAFLKDGTQSFSIEHSWNGTTWAPFITARYSKAGASSKLGKSTKKPAAKKLDAKKLAAKKPAAKKLGAKKVRGSSRAR